MIQHGRNLIIKVNGEAVAGARSCTISTDAETIEKASATNAKAREYLPGRTGWQVSCSHLVVDSQYISLPLSVGMVVDVQLVHKDTGIGLKGTAIIKKCDMTMTLGNLAQGSLNLLGTGALGSNVNILPSLESGWEGEDGDPVTYLDNYGISQADHVIYSPALYIQGNKNIVFSINSNLSSPDVIFCWINNNNWDNLSDIYFNGRTANRNKAGDMVLNGVSRSYYTFVTIEDAWLTICYDWQNPIYCPQLEYGTQPTPFAPPVAQ